MSQFTLAIHGGAGTITKAKMTDEKEAAYRLDLERSLQAGRSILEKGGSAIDATVAAVQVMEDSPMYNAGKGSVFTAEGTHEMDASIMCGATREAGGVTIVNNLKNPIIAARTVMTESDHVLLAGKGAEEFARKHNLEFVDNDYYFTDFRHKQWLKVKGTDKFQLDHTEDPALADIDMPKKMGTVGAVAMDKHGNIAASTSTGGMTNKRYNRIGDSPLIGCGNYANNRTCAVSCTGDGEFFMRAVAAYDVHCLMDYKGLSLQEACDVVIHQHMIEIKGEGGLVAVDAQGNIAMPFNSEGMYRGWTTASEPITTKIYGV